MKNKQNILVVTLSVLSMIFLIHIGSLIGGKFKLDATQERLYTLSEGSKAILNQLSGNIELKLYYSKTAANKGSAGIQVFNHYYRYIQSFLKEYVSNSNNHVKLNTIDPRPDTKEEEEAVQAGLKRFNLTETETYIFGLVVENEAGTKKVIEFFDPQQQENIEYEITKLIYSVNNPRKKTIGVLSSLPILQEDMSPYMAQMMRMQGRQVENSWIVTNLLKEFFTLKKLEPSTNKIEGVDTLLIVHPKGFRENTLWAIDQFVMNGGNVLLLVDPHAIVDTSGAHNPMMGPQISSSDLNTLTKYWGVELVKSEFAGDKYLTGKGQFNPMMPPTRILPILNCTQVCVDPFKDAVSGQLTQMTFLFPGHLKKLETHEGIKIDPILSTTDKGNSYKAQPQQLANPAMLWESFSEGKEPLILGYKIVGKFKSAFPNGVEVSMASDEKNSKDKNQNKSDKTEKLTGLTESKSESAIIVFSDVDFIHDQFAFRNNIFGTSVANDNSTLLMNALESLSGSKHLMAVRSKGKFNRSFDVIDAIEFEADQKTKNKVSLITGQLRKFQSELSQLGRAANEENIALIQSESLKKRKELNKVIAKLKSELRETKKSGRESVEIIGKRLQYANTLLIPIILIFIGLLTHKRRQKLMEKGE